MATLTELFFAGESGAREFVDLLGKIVRAQLLERNLLYASPAFLGYLGHSWEAGSGEALEDLALDAYEFVLVRKNSLAAQHEHHANIDGYFRLNVSHFLTERQRKHDPLGYSVFQNVSGGIALSRKAGAVAVTPASEPIRNESLVTYKSWSGTSVPSDPTTLRDAMFAQGDPRPLLEALATICEPAQIDVEQRVSKLHLVDSVIDGFHCRDLVEPLKFEVRATQSPGAAAGLDEMAFEGEGVDRLRVPVTELMRSRQFAVETVRAQVELADLGEQTKTNLMRLLKDMLENGSEWNQKACAMRLGVKPQRVCEWMSLLEGLVDGSAE